MPSEKPFLGTVNSDFSSLGEEILRRRRRRRLKSFSAGLELISEAGANRPPSKAAYGSPERLPEIKKEDPEKKKNPSANFRRSYRKLAIFAIAAFLIMAVMLYRSITATEPQPFLEAPPAGNASASPASTAEETPGEQKVVLHITGAVNNPGMLEVLPGTRVGEAIRKAGGHTPEAALESINLAMVVQDGAKIHVPRTGEQDTDFSGPGSDAAPESGHGQKINLNTASEKELVTLPRVGPSTARRIIEYRTKNGRFKNIEDLSQVSGIGAKTLEGLLPLITV